MFVMRHGINAHCIASVSDMDHNIELIHLLYNTNASLIRFLIDPLSLLNIHDI